MWGTTQGYVYLPTKDDTGAWKKTMYQWPLHKRNVVQYVLSASATRRDVYFSPAIFSKSKPEKEFVLGSHVLWAEYDGNAPKEWPSSQAERPGGALSAVPGPPSLRIQSSQESHQHCYWKLEELCTDTETLERINRAIAYESKSDTSGWDANQVLRPPFTTNFRRKADGKVVGEPADVVWLEDNDNTYHTKLFSHIKSFKELVDNNIDVGELPDVQVIIGKYTWNEDTLQLLLKEADDVPVGMRSSALMRVAYHCAELGMTDSEAYSLLIWADDKWGKFKQRSDRKKRLIDLINKARLKHPRAVEVPTFKGLMSTATAVQTDVPTIFGFKELLNLEVKIEWAVKDLMPRGGFGMISSASGVGKTQFMMNYAMRTCLSRDFLGWMPMGEQKIMFLQLEMGPGPFKYFASNMAGAYNGAELERLQNQFLLAPINEPIPLHHPKGQAFLEAILTEYQPDGIILDSLGKVHLGSLNDDEAIRKTMVYINYIRSKFGVYVWLIHHNRKGQEGNRRPRKLEDMYGNQYLTTDLDVALSLWKEDSGLMECRVVKNRLAAERSPFMIQRIEHLQYIETDRQPQAEQPKGIVKDDKLIGLQPGVLPGGNTESDTDNRFDGVFKPTFT